MLEQLSPSQRERLAYIEFRLYFLGKLNRADLIERFGIGPAGATRDLAQYKELAPNNIEFDTVLKMYVSGHSFTPIFVHTPTRVLTALSQGFGDGVTLIEEAIINCELPPSFNRIDIDTLAAVTRAIATKKAISLQYFSGSSGLTQREIVPFALANDGMRWHARAFDRKRGRFTDFVISRMESAQIINDGKLEKNELPENDHQWNRIVALDLVPHPKRPPQEQELAKRDYGMINDTLHVKIRAALAGYFLTQWHVDCSIDNKIDDPSFRLWLKDNLALYQVESAAFAPGYMSRKKEENPAELGNRPTKPAHF